MSSDLLEKNIPFSFFCSLLCELSRAVGHKHGKGTYPALRVFARWTEELRRCFVPLPNGTTRNVFRLLFPEEDARRKYGMQEKMLCLNLAECLGVSGEEFRRWNLEEASGCLGHEVKRVLLSRSSGCQEANNLLSLSEVNNLLDELASTSEYSHASLHLRYPTTVRRSRKTILRCLYRSLSPTDASFVTQIILKDLRPLLYPLQSGHFTPALMKFNSVSVKMLSIVDAMRAWDSSGTMLRTYRLRGIIDDVTTAFEERRDSRPDETCLIGVFIQMPKSRKGRGYSDALSHFRGSKRVWAETKYDGERAQIHLDVLSTDESRITIFSKSKRDSTQDRVALHRTVLWALGIRDGNRNGETKVKHNVILDAEMVACQGESIDEFWRLRGLLENSSHRIGAELNVTNAMNTELSGTTRSRNGHLGVVFFDVMVLDSVPLVHLPYSQRRFILESLIETAPGHIYVAERTSIDLDNCNPERKLQEIFERSVSDFQEGIVLKAEESLYNDFDFPWVKLKKDHIPGHGDTLDLAIVGASWEKQRGRELRVGPTTFTTFFIGILTNAIQIKTNASLKPHFLIHSIASYGVTREQLEEVNFLLRSSGFLKYDLAVLPGALDYAFTICSGLSMPPAVMFNCPLLAEVLGAGFTKSRNSEYYGLRFPRLTRVYRASERTWRDGVDLQELQEIAYQCIGKERPNRDIEDWCKELWSKKRLPSERSWVEPEVPSSSWQGKHSVRETEITSMSTIHAALPKCQQNPASVTRIDTTASPDSSVDKRISLLREVNVTSVTVAAEVDKKMLTSKYANYCNGALVWLSKGTDKSLWQQLVPPNCCLHTLQSLIMGCGWQSVGSKKSPSGWVQRGLAVIHGQQHKDLVIEALKNLRTHDFHDTENRRPILVIDSAALTSGGDLENYILYILDT
ncbi:hypothetical protein AX17_003590 [Amanita inopinata Kibby_2008]|nr:hypothetical protein AX17_003590 [Amanita inopinata Kibby_2008]